MATKDKGKKKILDNQITFEFFGELETEIKPFKTQKQPKTEKTKIIKRKPKAIKSNHIKKNRKVRRS